MSFYETLEKVMSDKGLKPAEVCKKAKVYPSYISKLKSGHVKDATWEKAMAIITALDMTADEFYAIQKSL